MSPPKREGPRPAVTGDGVPEVSALLEQEGAGESVPSRCEPESRPKAGPLLDLATLTDQLATRELPGSVRVSLLRNAGEATYTLVIPYAEREYVARGEGRDPQRSAIVSAQRAASNLRRYAMANELKRLGTFTFAKEPETWDDAWDHVHSFRRKWRRTFGLEAMAVVPEHGEKNGRKHFHAALPRYVRNEQLTEIWGQGFTDVRMITSRNDFVSWGPRKQAMVCAQYLTAYVKKNFVEDHRFDKRRYSTTPGFTPEPEKHYFRSIDAARAWMAVQRDGPMYQSWSSAEMEDWPGTPVRLEWWELGTEAG